MLADMQASVDAARLLTWRAAWMGRNGLPFDHAEGSISKVTTGPAQGPDLVAGRDLAAAAADIAVDAQRLVHVPGSGTSRDRRRRPAGWSVLAVSR